MPQSFPDMQSLKFAAQMHKFREPNENETEAEFRELLADHVLMTGQGKIESMEIRTGKGWDQFNDAENYDLLTRGTPGMADLLASLIAGKTATQPAKTVRRTASGAVVFSSDRPDAKVLIVTSTKNKDRWVLPKGGVEPELQPKENADKETREEAGVAAQLFDEVGRYECEGKEGWQLEIYFWGVFVSLVDWEEYAIRRKEWVTVGEAVSRLGPDQSDIVKKAAIAHANHYGFAANATDAKGNVCRVQAD